MRITSELFVAQLVRRAFGAGGFGVIMRRGSSEAGAIFVVVRGRGGELELYSPAIQSMKEGENGLREFMAETVAGQTDLDRRFEREARFDPDFWLVEIEVDDAASLLDIVTP